MTMRSNFTIGAATLIILFGCSQTEMEKRAEKQAKMSPSPAETLPPWAFDAPHYFRPPPEVVPHTTIEPGLGQPSEYHVSKRVILVDRPTTGVPLTNEPRISVWWTNTEGLHWARAGCFGLGQTHFPLVAGDDADYGIRFVGPAIFESLDNDTMPHRVYHLDTRDPEITLTVGPHDPPFYSDEVIHLQWEITDPNLDTRMIELAVGWRWQACDDIAEQPGVAIPPVRSELTVQGMRRDWWLLDDEFGPFDMYDYVIPTPAEGEFLQFYVRARDFAGNVGIAHTECIQILPRPSDDQMAQEE